MAGKSLVAVWRDAVTESDLDRTAKLLALVLSVFMDRRGRAFPSQTTLAARASITDRGVRLATERLEVAGFLAIDRSPGRRSHVYAAALPATASAVRRSEWLQPGTPFPVGDGSNPEREALNPERRALNPERRSDESALKRLKAGALHATDALEGAAARAPLDDCGRCGTRAPLVLDDLYCIECARVWADDLVARARDQVNGR